MLLAAGCRSEPPWFPVPEQRAPVAAEEAKLRAYLEMGAANAEDHLVSDVLLNAGESGWKWTLQNPKIRFQLPDTEGLKFSIDITLPAVTFDETGPVSIIYRVEGRELGRQRYTKAGYYHFEKPVPAAWLTTKRPVVVHMTIDKLWVAKGDGAQRGFIISQVGFRR